YDPDHLADESLLLVLIQAHDRFPVPGDFRQAVVLAEIDEVQDVLLEAGPPESHTGFQELRADAAIGPDRSGDRQNVGARLLADRRDGVDRADALREKCVGRELRQLRGPDVGGEDALARYPARVDIHQLADRGLSFWSLGSTDQDAVRSFEIR